MKLTVYKLGAYKTFGSTNWINTEFVVGFVLFKTETIDEKKTTHKTHKGGSHAQIIYF